MKNIFHGKPLWLFSRLSVTEDGSKLELCWYNACTLVFSYNMGKRNSNLQFRFSFTHDVGKRNSNFYFPVSFFYYIENESGTSIFVFRFFSITSFNKIAIVIFRFSSCFRVALKTGIWLIRFSFLVFVSIMLSRDSNLLSRR